MDIGRNLQYYKGMAVKTFLSFAEALVSLFGNSVAIARTDRVSGGDINRAYALTLNTGEKIFMKANAKENAGFFTAEALGLEAIAKTGAIKTPKVLCAGTDDGEEVGYSFLLLEFIQSAPKKSGYWEEFGRALAAMHSAKTEIGGVTENGANEGTTKIEGAARFGFFENNYIGARPQNNTPCASWIEFFRERRLAPQFKAADSWFDSADRKKISRLLDRLDSFLVEPQSPSLLHGDLWSGNAMPAADGSPMLIDPACYVGHAEADLAMTQLFGGFPPNFYEAYKEARPLQDGWKERLDLYNLYQLLNHLNLFGASYLGAVKSVVDEYAG